MNIVMTIVGWIASYILLIAGVVLVFQDLARKPRMRLRMMIGFLVIGLSLGIVATGTLLDGNRLTTLCWIVAAIMITLGIMTAGYNIAVHRMNIGKFRVQ